MRPKRLQPIPFAHYTTTRSVDTRFAWTTASTVLADGTRRGPYPIHEDGTVNIDVPEGYQGEFEVWLHSDDDATLVVAEGRVLPSLGGA